MPDPVTLRCSILGSGWMIGMLAIAGPAAAAGVCSAWAEPARVAVQMQLRQRHRMRADREWVLAVARNPRAVLVLLFTAPPGCGPARFEGIRIDRALQSIAAKYSHAGSPLVPCVGGEFGYALFAVAVQREALPANPITVPHFSKAANFSDPSYCPRGLTIPALRQDERK